MPRTCRRFGPLLVGAARGGTCLPLFPMHLLEHRHRRRRRLLLRHGVADVRMCLLYAEACMHMLGLGVVSSEPVSIVGSSSSSETSDEQAGIPASIRLARRLYQAAARAPTSCFISVERFSRRALPPAVMTDVVQGRTMWSVCCGVELVECVVACNW